MANGGYCPWCKYPDSDDVDFPETLCRMHQAEYEGLTEEQLDRRDAEQYAEEADAKGWRVA